MNVEDAIYQLHELESDLRCSSRLLEIHSGTISRHVVQEWLDRASIRIARALDVLRDEK